MGMDQPPKSNPVNQNRRPVSARVKGAPMSKESKFIGYIVLGFGFLAVIAVLILALGGGNKTVSDTAVETPKETPQSLAAELRETPKAIKTPEKKDLFFKRDADFDAAKMNGDWQAAIGQFTAVLQIDKNVFQIILASPSRPNKRIYSAGTFKVLEDIIVLTPELSWPKPASSDASVAYDRLAISSYPVIATFDGGNLLWQNPPQSEKRVASPYRTPLVMSEDQDLIVWKRLK